MSSCSVPFELDRNCDGRIVSFVKERPSRSCGGVSRRACTSLLCVHIRCARCMTGELHMILQYFDEIMSSQAKSQSRKIGCEDRRYTRFFDFNPAEPAVPYVRPSCLRYSFMMQQLPSRPRLPCPALCSIISCSPRLAVFPQGTFYRAPQSNTGVGAESSNSSSPHGRQGQEHHEQ